MRLVQAAFLALMLLAVSKPALATTADGCYTDPNSTAGACLNANARCWLPTDRGEPTGACATFNGCTCFDKDHPPTSSVCSMAPLGDRATPTALTVFVAFLGLAAWKGRRIWQRRRA